MGSAPSSVSAERPFSFLLLVDMSVGSKIGGNPNIEPDRYMDTWTKTCVLFFFFLFLIYIYIPGPTTYAEKTPSRENAQKNGIVLQKRLCVQKKLSQRNATLTHCLVCLPSRSLYVRTFDLDLLIWTSISSTLAVTACRLFSTREPSESPHNPLIASTVSSRGRFGMRNMARMSAKTSFAACCCLFRQFPPFSGNFRLCSGNFRLCFGSGCFCVHVQFHEPLANCVSGIKSAADALNPHAIR